MNKTVDELLELIRVRWSNEPESFAKTASLRRLAQLRQATRNLCGLVVNIPKPEMSAEARELLKNSPKVSTPRSSRRGTQEKKAADAKPSTPWGRVVEETSSAAEPEEESKKDKEEDK